MSTTRFLDSKLFAVVGASNNRGKFGNRVLRHYLRHGRTAVPVNPRQDTVEGLRAYPDLAAAVAACPGLDRASIITPPRVTEAVVDQAIALGSITMLWMQPGAESPAAIAAARAAGIEVIAGGPCVLVEL